MKGQLYWRNLQVKDSKRSLVGPVDQALEVRLWSYASGRGSYFQCKQGSPGGRQTGKIQVSGSLHVNASCVGSYLRVPAVSSWTPREKVLREGFCCSLSLPHQPHCLCAVPYLMTLSFAEGPKESSQRDEKYRSG